MKGTSLWLCTGVMSTNLPNIVIHVNIVTVKNKKL
jgi:hypothetical protein